LAQKAAPGEGAAFYKHFHYREIARRVSLTLICSTFDLHPV
jgi:hypothetical protein